jgi:hypothetical protein
MSGTLAGGTTCEALAGSSVDVAVMTSGPSFSIGGADASSPSLAAIPALVFSSGADASAPTPSLAPLLLKGAGVSMSGSARVLPTSLTLLLHAIWVTLLVNITQQTPTRYNW